MGLEPGPSKEGSWMMAQNDLCVGGIDVAKDKGDVCIRSLDLRRTFASTAEGRRELASLLRQRKVGKAVMEASGGYEREWAKALRKAKIEVRIVDPNLHSFAGSEAYVCQHGGRPARVGLVAPSAEGRQGGHGGKRRVRARMGQRPASSH